MICDLSKDYVEIENSSGAYKVYNDKIPDVIVSNQSVELQEVYFSSEGKGHRSAYSYRPTVSFDFIPNNKLFSPIESKLHKHDYFELMLIASGQLEMQIESKLCEFHGGDACILNRSTRHAEHFKPDVRIFYIVLTPNFLLNWPQEEGLGLPRLFTKFFNKGLRDTLQQNKDFIKAAYTGKARTPPLRGIIEAIRREFEGKKPGCQLFIRGLLYRLLSVLANPEYYTAEYIDLGFDEGFSLAFSAKQILNKNKRKMTKTEVAERLNYNGEYINQVFKKHYGCTIPEYNRFICLRQASVLLCGTDIQIHEICKQLGFTNRTHFYDLFEREYGCTPAEYRKKAYKAPLRH